MHHKAVVVTVDVGGRIGLELDGDVRRWGVELESGERATVLAQDVGREVIAIVKRQYVVLSKMKAVSGHSVHYIIILSRCTSEKHTIHFPTCLRCLWGGSACFGWISGLVFQTCRIPDQDKVLTEDKRIDAGIFHALICIDFFTLLSCRLCGVSGKRSLCPTETSTNTWEFTCELNPEWYW